MIGAPGTRVGVVIGDDNGVNCGVEDDNGVNSGTLLVGCRSAVGRTERVIVGDMNDGKAMG